MAAMVELKPRPLVDGFAFLEAPKWREGALWVSDVFDGKVHALEANGRSFRTIAVPNRPSGLGFLSDGTLIIVSARDRMLLRLDSDRLSPYADLSRHTASWLNDFAVDRLDRIFVGNFGYDFVGGEQRRTTSLHRVDQDGTVETVADGLDFPNGSVVVDDGRTLIVAETWEARVTAFEIDATGRLGKRRVFADLVSRQPDGICADADGAIWAGIYNTGEFVRVREGGNITHRVRLPGSGVSCALGGENGRTLFMTAYCGSEADMAAGKRASAIFTAEVDVPAARTDR